MRRFVLGWKKLGLERRLGTRIVTYADDLVILCREGNADAALATTARDHGQAEAHGERGEDTNLQGAGRRVRLPGIHVRVDVFGENRPGPPGSTAIKEEHQAHGRESPRAEQPIGYLAKHHRAGGSVEPRPARVSQLLQRWYRQQSISRARQLHGCAVASNGCVPSTKSGGAGAELSSLAPLRAFRARTPEPTWGAVRTRPALRQRPASPPVREP